MKTIVLVCSVSIDPSACTVDNALDALRSAPAQNGATCALFGQAGVATTAIRPEPGKSYLKIICTRDRG